MRQSEPGHSSKWLPITAQTLRHLSQISLIQKFILQVDFDRAHEMPLVRFLSRICLDLHL